MPANVLIIGLEECLETELCQTLAELHHNTASEPFPGAAKCVHAIDRVAADLVFCPAESCKYEALLMELRKRGRAIPVIVVSRVPEVDHWLDAMDAGACDYCAAPFEPRMLRSIVENALRFSGVLAAAS
jgi:DNA-binding NtrC family response regulator